MSYQATQAVIDHSQTKGSERMLLLIIAHHADKESFTAYPSERTLQKEANMSERNLRYTLAKLKARGELKIDISTGRGRANLYTLMLPKKGQSPAPTGGNLTSAKGQSGNSEGGNLATKKGQHIAPQQQIEHSIEHQPTTGSLRQAKPDDVVIENSKHSLEVIKRYVQHRRDKGDPIRNPVGLAIWLRRSGTADDLIDEFLDSDDNYDVEELARELEFQRRKRDEEEQQARANEQEIE